MKIEHYATLVRYVSLYREIVVLVNEMVEVMEEFV